MFNKIERARIWDIVNNVNLGIVKDGKPVDCCLKNVMIPSMEEIAEEAMGKLKKKGFSVKRVSPRKANCVIRVFRNEEGMEYEDNKYWSYGTDAFLKTIEGKRSSYDTIIDYTQYRLNWWIYQDESLIMVPNFVDYFVKIS